LPEKSSPLKLGAGSPTLTTPAMAAEVSVKKRTSGDIVLRKLVIMFVCCV
jgi:hypothetical protein